MSYIGPWTSEILNVCINEFRKKTTREKISKNIIDPITREVTSKFVPYFTIHIIIQILIVILLIYLIVNNRKL